MSSRLRMQRIVRGSVVTAVIGSAALLPLTGTTPALAAVPNLCGHPADTVPPQISSLTFSAATADTTDGTTSVTLTALATDTATNGAGSGVKRLDAYLSGPHNSYVQVKFARSAGTTADGTWTGVATFTQKDWPGAYVLRDVTIIDAGGNYQDYPNYGTTAVSPTAVSLQTGWDSTLTLTGPTPTKTKPETVPAGTLTAFTASPTTVDTTTASKRVVLTAHFDGNQPKRIFATFFQEPQRGKGHRFFELHTRLRPAGHSWRGHITVPQWLGDVTPKAQLEVEFGQGVRPEYKDYDSTKLASLGFTSTLAITSSVDTTPPALTNLTFTPTSVDTTTGAQTVAVTATASDAVSGVKRIAVTFAKNTNIGIEFAAGSNPEGVHATAGLGSYSPYEAGGYVTVNLTLTGSQWTGTATFHRCVPIGKWHVTAELQDNATNDTYVSGAKLAKLGFPDTLQVAAAPQYVFDPVVTAATAGGAQHQITLDFNEGVKNLTTSNLTAYAMAPANGRYQTPLTITSIQCSNGVEFIDCSGSGGLVTSAVLDIPAVTGSKNYEVWADLGETASQITDAGGLPVSWQYAIAQVKGA